MTICWITKAQIVKIHVLKAKLGMADEDYRVMLGGWNVNTCTMLSVAQAAEVIDKMERMAISRGVQDGRFVGAGRRPAQPGRARDAASAAQHWKVRKLWRQVSRQPDDAAREIALNKFIKRQTGIENIKWLEHRHVGPVIKALEAMIEAAAAEMPGEGQVTANIKF